KAGDGAQDGGPGAPRLAADAEVRLRSLLEALKAVKQGNFSVRLPVAADGVLGEIAQAFNDVVSMNELVAGEIVRVSKVVGEEGKLTERPSLPVLSGMWASKAEAISTLVDSLAQQT